MHKRPTGSKTGEVPSAGGWEGWLKAEMVRSGHREEPGTKTEETLTGPKTADQQELQFVKDLLKPHS